MELKEQLYYQQLLWACVYVCVCVCVCAVVTVECRALHNNLSTKKGRWVMSTVIHSLERELPQKECTLNPGYVSLAVNKS